MHVKYKEFQVSQGKSVYARRVNVIRSWQTKVLNPAKISRYTQVIKLVR